MTDAEMQSSHLVLAGHRPLSESHFPLTVYTLYNLKSLKLFNCVKSTERFHVKVSGFSPEAG